jgi:hypothetical protein
VGGTGGAVGVLGGLIDEDVGSGANTGLPVPAGGVLLAPGAAAPLLGEGVVASLGGVGVVGSLGGVGVVGSLGGAGVVVSLGGEGVVVPATGAVVPLFEGGPGAVVGGEACVLLPVLLPPASVEMGVFCRLDGGSVGLGSPGVDVMPLELAVAAAGDVVAGDVVAGDVVAGDGDAVATTVEPGVPAGWSARACVATTSAKTIVARIRPSVVR